MSSTPQKTYDLAVLGGGIAGCAVARDAALRGLSVAVFEKNTVGSGTSSKSSKLIHGGIRYLELAWMDLLRLNLVGAFKNFRFVASSLKETNILAATAPGLVLPIRLLIPVYHGRGRGPSAVFFGARLYGWLSSLAGNDARPRILGTPEAALAEIPLLNRERLAGAVEIADYTTDDLALVRAVADAARRAGAEIFEQAEVSAWKKNLRDYEISVHANGTRHFVACRSFVNASGPWIDKNRASEKLASEPYVSLVGGSHIELPAFLGRSAVLEAQDGRVFFVLEKNGRARVGTTEWPCDDPDRVIAPASDKTYLLDSLKRYFPSKTWESGDILNADAGVRPLAMDPGAKNANRTSREHAIRRDADGVFHLAGVKLTDHRRAAEETVDRVMKLLGKDARSKTASLPLSS